MSTVEGFIKTFYSKITDLFKEKIAEDIIDKNEINSDLENVKQNIYDKLKQAENQNFEFGNVYFIIESLTNLGSYFPTKNTNIFRNFIEKIIDIEDDLVSPKMMFSLLLDEIYIYYNNLGAFGILVK